MRRSLLDRAQPERLADMLRLPLSGPID